MGRAAVGAVLLLLLLAASIPSAVSRPVGPPTLEESGRPVVVGFIPYWTADSYNPPSGVFTYLIFFSAPVGSDGSLDLGRVESHVDDIQRFRSSCGGCKLLLTLTIFNRDVADSVLAYHRDDLVRNTKSAVLNYGFDGINIDWEFMRSTNSYTGANNSDYLLDLLKKLKDLNIIVSASVAGGVEKVWRDSRLSQYLDFVFLMGYDYHYSGSSTTGPVSPILYSGLDVADSLAILDNYYPKKKIVLGLPLYGYDWPAQSCSPYSATTGRGVAKTYAQIMSEYSGYTVKWDSSGHVPWISYTKDGQCRQVWFDNVTSLMIKIDYAIQNGYGGFGFWALGYTGGDEEFEAMLESRAVPARIEEVTVQVDNSSVKVYANGTYWAEEVFVNITAPGVTYTGYQAGDLGSQFNSLTVSQQGDEIVVHLEKAPDIPGHGVEGSGLLAVINYSGSPTNVSASAKAYTSRINVDRSTYKVEIPVGEVNILYTQPPGGGQPPG
ncbi:MAG: glycoside hydrolase family 18 protein, partial [Desulfurococcales archaeon]|nr:glycoside hydrolase family 18 protein [Desulfurococcales archaeon]